MDCQQCQELLTRRNEAHREWAMFKPFHTCDRRPKSRWTKGDKEAHAQLERIYNLADAEHRLHLATHEGQTIDARDAVKYQHIIWRGGRTKP